MIRIRTITQFVGNDTNTANCILIWNPYTFASAIADLEALLDHLGWSSWQLKPYKTYLKNLQLLPTVNFLVPAQILI
ncbi:hypothetical protein [Coleofasciculus sp. G2-EDA-02]|uniref:hypothetical protein n=1 Tax=Coleofasciculus sp. G2-EDA-02 TaxID=3069529 RepID=UPI003302EE0E